MNNKITYVIFAVSMLLIPYFIFQIIHHKGNLGWQIYSGLMINCSIIAALLIVSHWRDVKINKLWHDEIYLKS
ncbi:MULTISPECIES: hypothetical protein [Oceanobacillus]|uniref:Uncharacterized protein n=2 Tax=Oceanobacillus TaxID=182709 RepID=A0A0A1MJR0_9BACI|nr:hypothetical protein [Oceanobacillus oncorhynchi]MDM8099738.1 hypothetical protein [Oceanobacillus oncorhynchi]CEI83308.1 hypothetical protein BN997_03214 [Oceanobacillus oncorhynchi]